MKQIYFCVDEYSMHLLAEISGYHCYSYEETVQCIKLNDKSIVTNSMAHFSFDLIVLGYEIWLCYRDKQVKIEPHMDLSGIGEPCKDLRFSHNIRKMFISGIFDELIGYERNK